MLFLTKAVAKSAMRTRWAGAASNKAELRCECRRKIGGVTRAIQMRLKGYGVINLGGGRNG